jgi:hypothetical protein
MMCRLVKTHQCFGTNFCVYLHGNPMQEYPWHYSPSDGYVREQWRKNYKSSRILLWERQNSHNYNLCFVLLNTYGPLNSSSSSSIGTTTLVVSACSTVVEHSQQGGFRECRCQRHVQPPTWRRTRDLERSNFRHKRPPASEATPANPAAEGGTMTRKGREILPKLATSTSLLGSFTCRKALHGTDGFTSPPKESMQRIFFARKLRRLRPGLNPRTWEPKASTLPLDHRSRCSLN